MADFKNKDLAGIKAIGDQLVPGSVGGKDFLEKINESMKLAKGLFDQFQNTKGVIENLRSKIPALNQQQQKPQAQARVEVQPDSKSAQLIGMIKGLSDDQVFAEIQKLLSGLRENAFIGDLKISELQAKMDSYKPIVLMGISKKRKEFQLECGGQQP